MPFKPGQSGNPGGRAVEKLVSDALRIAANEETDDGGVKKRKLRVAAEKIVDKAVKGDLAAFTILADRLEGKPAQAVTLGGDPENPLELTITGLMERIDGRSRDNTGVAGPMERPALAAKPPVYDS